MKKIILSFIICSLCMIGCKESAKEKTLPLEVEDKKLLDIKRNFSIEILDESAHQIIDSMAKIEILASGFKWTEGPLWIEQGKYLLFSDIPENKIYKLDSKGNVSTYLQNSGFTGPKPLGKEPGSNGLLLNHLGELVLMQHGDRQVAKMNATLEAPRANYSTLVNNYKGKKFNSPNDGVFDQLGNLYFTDPPYGLPLNMDDPTKELDFQGVYCLLKSGELLLLDKLSRPNGIGISKDGSKLFVAVSDPENAVWYTYDIQSAGLVSNRTVFFDVNKNIGKEGYQGLPDGLKVNAAGIIFATGPGGLWIFNNNGKLLARIYTGQLTSNCALSKDEKKLFMTADDIILTVALK